MSLEPMQGVTRFKGIPAGHFSKDKLIVVDVELCPSCEKPLLLVYSHPRMSNTRSWRKVVCQSPVCNFEDDGEDILEEIRGGDVLNG
jgi:hypothetical protein